MKRFDVVFVIPANDPNIFQCLGNNLTAIEPPAQAGLMANYLRIKKCSVKIIDAQAERLTPQEVADIINMDNPYLVVVVVYGHQPSASTQNMPAARMTCEAIKQKVSDTAILMIGTHPSALPERTLAKETIDFVCDGEGFITIYETLNTIRSGSSDFSKVASLWYLKNGIPVRSLTSAPLIRDLDTECQGVAWDLLPMGEYRAHNWHCFGNVESRKPYAALHTSFGCPFSCVFCCISAPFGKPSYRMFSPECIIRDIDILVHRYGVRNIKFIDELFVLNENHVNGICDLIIQRGYDLNIWAYARVDTAKECLLDKMRKAGIRWLCLGIESGSKYVRDGAEKIFSNEDIIKVTQSIRNAGIYLLGNYMFGLPDDTFQTMQKTLDLALAINTEWANFYCVMAYPGSKLYGIAKKNKLALPDDSGGPGWIGYSQHAYQTMPLPTNVLTAADILRFRDNAFKVYFSNSSYLNMIRCTFGKETLKHVQEMNSITLRRKLLE